MTIVDSPFSAAISFAVIGEYCRKYAQTKTIHPSGIPVNIQVIEETPKGEGVVVTYNKMNYHVSCKETVKSYNFNIWRAI